MLASASATTPPPGPIRDRAAEILGRAEFQHHRSLLQRALDWIAEQLARFSFGVGGGGPGFVGDLVGFVLLAAAVALVVVLVRHYRRPARRPREEPMTVEEEARRSAGAWAADASRFEAEGLWREAVRARYRELVRVLGDDGALSDIPGRTAGEYRVELGATVPDAGDEFDTVTEVFEDVWYGGRDATRGDVDRLRDAAAAVRAHVHGREHALVGVP